MSSATTSSLQWKVPPRQTSMDTGPASHRGSGSGGTGCKRDAVPPTSSARSALPTSTTSNRIDNARSKQASGKIALSSRLVGSAASSRLPAAHTKLDQKFANLASYAPAPRQDSASSVTRAMQARVTAASSLSRPVPTARALRPSSSRAPPQPVGATKPVRARRVVAGSASTLADGSAAAHVASRRAAATTALGGRRAASNAATQQQQQRRRPPPPPPEDSFDNANLEEILGAADTTELDDREFRRYGADIANGRTAPGRLTLGPARRTTLHSYVARQPQPQPQLLQPHQMQQTTMAGFHVDTDRLQKRTSIYAGPVRVPRRNVATEESTRAGLQNIFVLNQPPVKPSSLLDARLGVSDYDENTYFGPPAAAAAPNMAKVHAATVTAPRWPLPPSLASVAALGELTAAAAAVPLPSTPKAPTAALRVTVPNLVSTPLRVLQQHTARAVGDAILELSGSARKPWLPPASGLRVAVAAVGTLDSAQRNGPTPSALVLETARDAMQAAGSDCASPAIEEPPLTLADLCPAAGDGEGVVADKSATLAASDAARPQLLPDPFELLGLVVAPVDHGESTVGPKGEEDIARLKTEIEQLADLERILALEIEELEASN
ncbi:hypothetical protein HK405_008103 [Cladochytrium tenue]|nr:hypothetical protein HK405_008103 [Cladochytrium tenue]